MFAGLKQAIWGTAERWFPDRQIYHRSDGQVSYFAVTTGMQISALVSAAVLAGWLCFTTVSVALHGQALAQKDDELERHDTAAQQRIATALSNEATMTALLESRLEEFDRTAIEFQVRHDTLRRLMDFADQLSGHELAPSPSIDGGRVVMAATAADPTPREARDPLAVATITGDTAEDQISSMITEQDAVLARVEDATEARLENLRGFLRLTGMNIEETLSSGTDTEEQGGPFIPISESLSISSGLNLDAEFESRIVRITSRLIEVEELEQFIEAGPFGEPVGVPHRRTSPYGYRRDPFNNRRALHSGMDFGAYRRAPITATGPGEIVYAGWRSGYGRVVEIDHGYGFMTRYGHMHEIAVRRGDTVERGQTIGGMGSTGRSTATHLHYEIWHNGDRMDPAHLLRAGQYVQQE